MLHWCHAAPGRPGRPVGIPELAIEILSESEEWAEKLDRYDELGIQELVSFDPETERLRIWDRVDDDLIERVIEGRVTPCLTLDAYWVVAAVDGTTAPRLARDPAGSDLWPTESERIAELEEELRQARR